LGAQQVAARGGERFRRLGRDVAVISVGDDGGYLGERADPVHGDVAELARVGEHVGGAGVGDYHAPRRHLVGVVIGKPGLGVHAAGAEERLVRVDLREEGVGLRAVAGRVARADLAAGQQQLDLFPGRKLHGDGDRVGEHPPAEVRGQCPGHLKGGGADVDDDRVLRLHQAGGQRGDRALAVVVRAAARGERALGGLHGKRAAVDALQQAGVAQPAQVTADRLHRHAEHPGQVLGRHGARLANLGEDRLTSLCWHHGACPLLTAF
jgi:hypothetical protein